MAVPRRKYMIDIIKRKAIYDRAWRTFGKTEQMDVAIEEMAELTKEILKFRRAKTNIQRDERLSNIADEIADVEIMMEQLKYKLEMEQTVAIRKARKITRLDEYIKNHLDNSK